MQKVQDPKFLQKMMKIIQKEEPNVDLNNISEEEMMVYRHDDFWHCMDTARDYKLVTELWESGLAPWKLW